MEALRSLGKGNRHGLWKVRDPILEFRVEGCYDNDSDWDALMAR